MRMSGHSTRSRGSLARYHKQAVHASFSRDHALAQPAERPFESDSTRAASANSAGACESDPGGRMRMTRLVAGWSSMWPHPLRRGRFESEDPMATPLPFQPVIEAVVYRSAVDPSIEGVETDLRRLCEQAGVPLRATAPPRTLLVYTGSRQIRTPAVDIVGVPTRDLTSPEAALRALEALAHSFHDHAARACVCHQGLFYPPIVASKTTRGRSS